MKSENLRQLIADVQKRQSEMANVEAKAGRGGTPRLLYEVLSAFANRTGGRVLLFRLAESKDSSIIGIGHARSPQAVHLWKTTP
jgi:hypothetical protein